MRPQVGLKPSLASSDVTRTATTWPAGQHVMNEARQRHFTQRMLPVHQGVSAGIQGFAFDVEEGEGNRMAQPDF